jgi:hypothetical protein
MNIYARYFDREILVYSIEELIEFLSSISEINVTNELVEDITAYVNGDMPYPKRYKIRPRVYFILIKTTASSMEEFKMHKKNASISMNEGDDAPQKEIKNNKLQEELHGWYKGEINFKRVIQIPGTGKFQYQDTQFSAYVKATSGMECYTRIVNHLKGRDDVDLRSQFPSAKGGNFKFEFIG